ncbi:hypothetical protein HanXRQr2_Chr07g0294011 [Helianthus annuus]|uniref:Uncharacterized protein n=1 Tax=Helianthus annuus TaxID=4232 RepID=A0A9K3NFQ9_HELAN|nr:hypothetical protein HanXRQr2_Chr07g0294011 [Helianthus annuus]KAJ0904639.1 hypothetical protein HanPSC8_Chr07g0284611 [Helianthus annuus]
MPYKRPEYSTIKRVTKRNQLGGSELDFFQITVCTQHQCPQGMTRQPEVVAWILSN